MLPKKAFVVSSLLFSLNKLPIEKDFKMCEGCSPPSELSNWESYILNLTSLLPHSAVNFEVKPEYGFKDLQILLNCSRGNAEFIAPEDEMLFLRNCYNTNHSAFRIPLSFGEGFLEVKQVGLKLRGWIPENIVGRFKALYSMGLGSYLEKSRKRFTVIGIH